MTGVSNISLLLHRHKISIFALFTLFFTTLLLFFNLHFTSLLCPLDPVTEPQVSHLSTDHTLQNFNERGHLWLSSSNLPFLIDELMRINHSVRNELIELDQRRRDLLTSMGVVQSQLEQFRFILLEHSRRFMRLRATIIAHESHLAELTTPSVLFYEKWPSVRLHFAPPETLVEDSRLKCTMDTCLNWNHCPLGDFFKFCAMGHSAVPSTVFYALMDSPHYVGECKSVAGAACVEIAHNLESALNCSLRVASNIHRTCLVILVELDSLRKLFEQIHHESGRSHTIIAASHFPQHLFRPDFDFVFPASLKPLVDIAGDNTGSSSVRLVPGRRPILLALRVGRSTSAHSVSLSSFESVFLKRLEQLSNQSMYPKSHHATRVFLYQTSSDLTSCWPEHLRQSYSNRMLEESDWFPCADVIPLLQNSTFGIVLDTVAQNVDIAYGWQLQLLTCLSTGAVPVVFGRPHFPLDEAISPEQWSRAVLHIPRARVQELPIILQSIPESHIVELRRHGQILFHRHLKDITVQLASLFLAISRRLGLPQPPSPEWNASPAFRSASFTPEKVYQVPPESTFQSDLDDFLGPIGPQHDSPRFSGNYTSPGGSARLAVVSSMGDAESTIDPFWLHPSLPWDVPMPSDAAFSTEPHTRHGLRPINHTINMAGFEYNMDLGGLYPYEQFTIVLLTYNRFDHACQTLERLLGVPYLHSVVVVWNHPIGPSSDLKWPQLHVPVKVVRSRSNSLNNRFLPYNLIRTDAVLSLDDDVQLRHDEIVFGFRVWREHRDQLVGFPARSHYWDANTKEWYYHSDYTCEFSMTLTGASFLHKYYMFAYTWEMSSVIRKMVDEQMNCEDVAMNFLVAHLTRKPPLKVTIHWTFSCPTCGTTLHDQPEHYKQRSNCINWLTQFYGYNPLVYSQYRADSLLFKTRIPPTKQKCYKYI